MSMLNGAKVVESVATARQVALVEAIKIVLYVVAGPVLSKGALKKGGVT